MRKAVITFYVVKRVFRFRIQLVLLTWSMVCNDHHLNHVIAIERIVYSILI